MKLMQRQQSVKIRLPSIKPKDYGLTDDEKLQYGDRVPTGYEKLELLGRGGFALVWLAQGQSKVALKQIPKPVNCRDLNFIDIRSPNIIEIMKVENTHKDVWLVQELGGITLSKYLHSMKGEFYKGERVYAVTETENLERLKANPNEFIYLLKGILTGIKDIHAKNIAHCDLKPDNILMCGDIPKIIDFGSAFSIKDQDNFGMITPEYMAPEVLDIIHNWNKYSQNYRSQIEALKDQSLKIDIWSFGAIILDLINGIPNWLSYKGKIVRSSKIQLKFGLFAAKGRSFDKIIVKQQQLQLHSLIRANCQFLCNQKIQQFEEMMQWALEFNPERRASAEQLLALKFFCID